MSENVSYSFINDCYKELTLTGSFQESQVNVSSLKTLPSQQPTFLTHLFGAFIVQVNVPFVSTETITFYNKRIYLNLVVRTTVIDN